MTTVLAQSIPGAGAGEAPINVLTVALIAAGVWLGALVLAIAVCKAAAHAERESEWLYASHVEDARREQPITIDPAVGRAAGRAARGEHPRKRRHRLAGGRGAAAAKTRPRV